MKRLYLMRHGQTLFNQQGKIQGACDSPLTAEGIAQAQLAKKYFEHQQIRFDGSFSSTQERAADTAEIVCDYLPVQRIKGLKEWNFGLFEGEREALNPKVKPEETSYGEAFVAYGGESSQMVQERMDKTIHHLCMQSLGKQLLAVSHGGAMYMFIQKYLSFDQVKQLSFRNCCILVFDYNSQTKEFIFIECVNPETL